MEEVEKNEIVKIEYTRPKFWHRIIANFIDIFIFVVHLIVFFFIIRNIVQSTPSYQHMTNRMYDMQLESGLYVKSKIDDRIVDIVYDCDKLTMPYGSEFDGLPSDEGRYVGKNGIVIHAINTFIDYAKNNTSEKVYKDLVKYYDDIRLTKTYNDIHFYILQDNQIVPNQTLASDGTKLRYFYSDIYKPTIEKYCIPCFQANVQEYASILRTDFNLLVFVEFTISYVIAGVLTYYVPGFIFRRGRKTFGKALYRVGLVDQRILSPTKKRFTVRFLIFFFMELVLSLFTFGLPYIISFSMMAFSKRKQGFPDYILRLQEIDTSKNNIYMNYVEAQLKNGLHGKAIDFQMIKPL